MSIRIGEKLKIISIRLHDNKTKPPNRLTRMMASEGTSNSLTKPAKLICEGDGMSTNGRP